jgi:hypothetical protein
MFRCAVVEIQGVWKLAYNDMQFGRFDDRRDAMDAAMRLASLVARRGGESEILVQTGGGELRLAPWT